MTIEPWGAVDDLVVATGGRDEQLEAAIAAAGPAAVADLLAAEVRIRGTAPPQADGATVALTIEHRGEEHPYTVTFKGGDLAVEPGRAPGALSEVRHGLVDLARLVYAPRPGVATTSREVRVVAWPWVRPEGDLTPDGVEELVRRGEADREHMAVAAHARFAEVFAATNAVIDACSAAPTALADLAARHGSDKWGGLHWYAPHYEAHLGAHRYDPVRVLEVGIGGYAHQSLGGDSLRTWQRYFPRGLVVGMDIHAKPNVVGPRIRTIQGDQGEPARLRRIGDELGPFDLVVDDGSHLNAHVRTTFEALFPYVRPGGLYVIEDLHTSYWPAFGGEPPPGSAATTMGLLKDLLDVVNASEHSDDDEAVAPPGSPTEVSVAHNIALLRKGPTAERGVPAWIKARASGGGGR